MPECSQSAVYRAICTRLSGAGPSGPGNSGAGAGAGGGTAGAPVTFMPPSNALGETSSAAPSVPAELPVSDDCAATKTFDDNTCDVSACTKILGNGLLSVDPNVEIVGSLSRPGDESDCFTFQGRDDVEGAAEILSGEKIEIALARIPEGHEYEIQLFFIKEYDIAQAQNGPSACGSNEKVTEMALSRSGDVWSYAPGLLAGKATGQYFVVVKRKPGVGSDCGGEYRLIINGLR
ncbi:MAG: hypothetical protein H6714_11225 [Myxococcales bacterium]|nr:hypothetical protein [Myxococcales bacterium]